MTRAESRDEQITDLRVACLARIAELRGVDSDDPELMDSILGITNDAMWRVCRVLGLDRAPDLGNLSDSDMDAIVNEIIATHL